VTKDFAITGRVNSTSNLLKPFPFKSATRHHLWQNAVSRRTTNMLYPLNILHYKTLSTINTIEEYELFILTCIQYLLFLLVPTQIFGYKTH
jgi:hypothetical protein